MRMVMKHLNQGHMPWASANHHLVAAHLPLGQVAVLGLQAHLNPWLSSATEGTADQSGWAASMRHAADISSRLAQQVAENPTSTFPTPSLEQGASWSEPRSPADSLGQVQQWLGGARACRSTQANEGHCQCRKEASDIQRI